MQTTFCPPKKDLLVGNVYEFKLMAQPRGNIVTIKSKDVDNEGNIFVTFRVWTDTVESEITKGVIIPAEKENEIFWQ